jgi:Mlc titration factor MtfA (ptsG expression regulator)
MACKDTLFLIIIVPRSYDRIVMLEFLFYPVFVLVLLAFTRKFPFHSEKYRNDPEIDLSRFVRVDPILQTHIPYYRKLTAAGKKWFFYRLDNFIQQKEFIGMEGLVVTAEMKAVITAPAIQLTFGLKNFSLDTINTIEVHPDTFYSRFHREKLKGVTTGTGVLAVSWKDIQEGYRIEDDRTNLGLHEMAHALKLTVVRHFGYDMNFASYLENWLAISLDEFLLMKNEEGTFMRSYGGTNTQEFFAVAVEHFFEVPAEFKEALPDIYNHLCILLNQDPLNDRDDYRLKPGFAREINLNKKLFPVPEKIIPNYGYSNWHWTLSLLFIGIISILALPFAALDTIIESSDVWRITGGIFATGAIVFYKPVVKAGVMRVSQFFWYLIIVIVPFGLSLFFILNKTIIISSTVEEAGFINQKLENGAVVLKPESYDRDYWNARTVEDEDNPPSDYDLRRGNFILTYYRNRGIFGYVTDKKVIERKVMK